MDRTGLARSTVYHLIAEGRFPSPVKLSKRAVAWRQSEIDEWISQRVAACRDDRSMSL